MVCVMLLFLLVSSIAGCFSRAKGGRSGDSGLSGTSVSTPYSAEYSSAESVISGNGWASGNSFISGNQPDSSGSFSSRGNRSNGSSILDGVKSSNPASHSMANSYYQYKKQAWEYEAENKAKQYESSAFTLDFNATGKTITGSLYSAGYDGWGDITDERSVSALKEIHLKYLRIAVDMNLAAGPATGGNVDISCVSSKDGGLTLTERIKTAQKNGFTPVLALTNYSLPSYFYPAESKPSYWFQYNKDGTKSSVNRGNQIDEYARIAKEITRKLKAAGVSGLLWETIYEIGYGYEPFYQSPVYIHYATAKAIKEVDGSAKFIGPATFTGWCVEKFLDDYFSEYGAEGSKYLDFVSFHQYGGNYIWNKTDLWKYDKQFVSMVKSDNHVQNGFPIKNLSLLKILSSTPKEASNCVKKLKSMISQKSEYYGFTKKIGVAITEYDVNNYSNYLNNPSNDRYPQYNAASDTSINTNYFGGVTTAYLLTTCSLSGADLLMKFNTRSYYGIVDNDCANQNVYYRTPLWYSFKLLQEKLGLTSSSEIIPLNVTGPKDTDTGYSEPWIFACGVKKNGRTNILVINRGTNPSNVMITLKNMDGKKSFTRFVYGENTTAQYIGNRRTTGKEYDGIFEGGMDDGWTDYKKNIPGSSKNICLFPMGTVNPLDNQIKLTVDAFSYVVLQMN